eukprot:1883580-Pleurochrysis_carterae.AAC.2
MGERMWYTWHAACCMHLLTTGRQAHSSCRAPRGGGGGAATIFTVQPGHGSANLLVQVTPRSTVCRLSSLCTSRAAPSRRTAVRQCACASTEKTWQKCVAFGIGSGALYTCAQGQAYAPCDMQHANAQTHQSVPTVYT